MPGLRPNLAIVTLVVEIAWLVVAIAAYESELGDNVHSSVVSLAAIALIWAAPAIAVGVVAWLIEQGLRGRGLAPPAPAPPPPPVAPPPPPAAG